MSDDHSTNKPPKPPKPYPEFPLTYHPTGRWCKKIRGRIVYFGYVRDGWEAALEKFNKERDDLYAGRKPRDKKTSFKTIRDLVNDFWNSKRVLYKSGEITPRTFDDYTRICEIIVKHIDKSRAIADIGPDDFLKLRQKLSEKNGPVSLANLVQRIRTVFKFAFDIGIIENPIRFGPDFKRPSKKTMRLEKARRGPKVFAADEIRTMLEHAGQPLRSMILLGVNCGFGNSDVGTLPKSAVDLESSWVNYHRPKTGINRRCPLWPETVDSLKDWLTIRPAPNASEHAELVFLTKRGGPWAKDKPTNPLSAEMRKLLNKLGIKGRRNFYALRHVFQTVGDDAKDFVAVRIIMGHAGSGDIADIYRDPLPGQKVSASDKRLLAVTEHVRRWLFGDDEDGGKILPLTQHTA